MKGMSIKWIRKTSLICSITLVLLFCLSLYIKVALPYNNVFTDLFVKFGGNDPWYNMRLVENTLHHFPHRIYFDAFTFYPHGANVPFAPLFDLLLAFVIWILGLGNPFSTLGLHGIEVIGAWYPAVLGALTVFPVYFIGKELYNKDVGLFSAALIAILPGQFLARSLLGFTDHHVAETLFSTIAMLFFILAIKSAKENEITFHSIFKKDWDSLKKPLIYSIFAGIFLGSYFLSWIGAPLFIFILLVYAVVQHVVDHLRGKSTDYLCIIGVPVFLIPLAMISPVLHPGSLSEFHVISLILGIIVFSFLSALSFLAKRKKIDPYGYPIAILGIGVVSLVLLSVLSPSIYSMLIGKLVGIFIPSGSALTIGEVHPMHILSPFTGRIAEGGAWNCFTTAFFIAFIAFAWVVYNIARKWRAEEILFVTWSIVILFACFGQRRFAAYYAVNVAILCGFISWKVLDIIGFKEEGAGIIRKEREKETKKTVKGKKKENFREAQKAKTKPKDKQKNKDKSKGTSKSKSKVKITGVTAEKIKKYLHLDIIITFFIIFLVVFYPPLNMSLTTAKGGGGPDYDWYESLSWLNKNTPDPGVDYYALYKEPPPGEDYLYPEAAYSVMSWWDYGHWITRIAHRIPVANPFQQGIGGPHRGDEPGACVFFIAKNESEANKVADDLGVRYVISDFMMADAWGVLYDKFGAMTVWADDTGGYYARVETEKGPKIVPTAKYYKTMEARLHIFDGRGITLSKNFYLEPLHHYRLIHESPSTIISVGEQEIKFVKVFEYVKGARIEGKAPDGSVVKIETNITTNQGRKFIYTDGIISNGSYKFVVPYSTEGPLEGGTNFDVLASPYKIRVGYLENEVMVWGMEKEIRISEEEIMNGKTIRMDLL